jgi:hypothetical protein
MIPKEKAKELISDMGFSTGVLMDAETGEFKPMYRNQYAKECALKAVDQIMDALDKNGGGWDFNYWEEVKQEIEKL